MEYTITKTYTFITPGTGYCTAMVSGGFEGEADICGKRSAFDIITETTHPNGKITRRRAGCGCTTHLPKAKRRLAAQAGLTI